MGWYSLSGGGSTLLLTPVLKGGWTEQGHLHSRLRALRQEDGANYVKHLEVVLC